jgi:serine/threonine protein kinase
MTSGVFKSRFRVERVLGQGAFGRAEHVVEVSTGQAYALKTSSITSQSLRASALREVSLLRRLVHPNVVTIHGEWEHHTNELCVLLELCDGSLQDMISAGRALGRL